MGVYVQVESNGCSTGYSDSPFDDGPYSGYSHEINHYGGCSVLELTDKVEGRLGYRTKKFDVDLKAGDIAFVVVALYSTGGTFGRTEGNPSVLAVFKTAEEAIALKEFVADDYEKYKNRQSPDWTLNFEGTEVYAEWKGYFESLDAVYVETEVVKA